jgi:LemA protein
VRLRFLFAIIEFMSVTTIVLIVVGVILLWGIFAFNGFVRLRYRTQEALSDIEVQLKRRYDLIPNIVEAVKGYVKHERETLEKVTEARTKAMQADNLHEKAGAENMLTNTLKTLFALSENYPDLKANANFLDLQRELSDTENKIQAARRFYNSQVRDLNTKVESFPPNIIARLFGFKKQEFFETEEELEKEPVKVRF